MNDTSPMRVSLIAAVATNGVIGRNNELPWRLRDDMRFFRRMTSGHVVITGRKNFDAMGGPLPKRQNIVVTRNPSFTPAGVSVCASIEEALRAAAATGEQEVFVIGGAEIYARALPYAETFYRTRVLADVPGDVRFPAFDETEWSVVEVERRDADAENEHAFVIEALTRKGEPQRWR